MGAVCEYIQAVPKRGYRFVAGVTEVNDQSEHLQMEQAGTTRQTAREFKTVARDTAMMSLAVLPILDGTADPSVEHLVDGLAENIVNGLSLLPELHVRACSTLRRYERRRVDPQEVGRELGVEAVLIGKVLQSGDDIFIRVELVEVKNGWQLWGEQYSEKFSNIFKAQAATAKHIAEQIRLKLTSLSIQ